MVWDTEWYGIQNGMGHRMVWDTEWYGTLNGMGY